MKLKTTTASSQAAKSAQGLMTIKPFVTVLNN